MRGNELTKNEPQSMVAPDRRPTIAPPVDVYESADELLLVADLPGVLSDALDVHVNNGELLLEARRDVPVEGRGGDLEFGDCNFQRRFTVPAGIDVGRINAELKDGLLRLRLPKSEGLKPRKIEVRAG
jgi:HSP20 family protein